MLQELSKVWWAFLVRGLVAVVFGALALTWPTITLAILVVMFGAYAFLDGVFLVVKAINSWKVRDDRWLLMLAGLLGVGIGVITFFAPRV
ncbi:MAG TPA: DUF308 domain-containing protein, partial [Spirochaetia bacterium]|nr:DUF308 domain-containing protein [Spirochaetia bacterium]